jgi:GNAT superfamily N-acetyltransferase
MSQVPISSRMTFRPVVEADFEPLLALRIAAMRESLERVGRFDPDRARERLRHSFYPEHTHWVLLDGAPVGFYAFRPMGAGFRLDHLYVHPNFQSLGIGGCVLRMLLAQAEAAHCPVTVGALRDSASNRFYQRHGFVQTSEDVWDIEYVWMIS